MQHCKYILDILELSSQRAFLFYDCIRSIRNNQLDLYSKNFFSILNYESQHGCVMLFRIKLKNIFIV